ncbi:MAG TPA: SgcJ/EcaC family oxidoreductase [Thermoleophilaceae bacterium]|nr:SgcJ/EcaC family oxidoreductase [Thermoleophilaceae bacterium]
MTTSTHTPEATIRHFSTLLAERDLDALVDLYEPDAAFAPRPGEAVAGRDAIREALRRFLALEPRMTGEIERVLLAGETALVANRWVLTGTQPDGTAVEMAGVSADVLRRRADGAWGIAIDDPWGGGVAG